jgi:hypothetical protein
MKTIPFLFCLLLFYNFSLGQIIYSAAQRVVDNGSYFTNEFYLFADSSCYLKQYYSDNSTYNLYKGRISRLNDTTYKFNYQPIVEFSLFDRYGQGDSIGFWLDQIDTLQPDLNYHVKVGDEVEQSITIKKKMDMVFIKDVEHRQFVLDTKFNDPVDKKRIFMTISNDAQPYIIYYGTKTAIKSIKISIIKNKLTIPSDEYHFKEKAVLLLAQ